LRRAPVFAVTLLGVLAVGIGAATAMFSVATSVLVRPLPFADAEQLTSLSTVEPEGPGPVSVRDFLDWKEQATSFSEMTAVSYGVYSASSEGEPPEPLSAALVSGDYFPMLRISALHGRMLGPEDDRPGGPKVVVLSASVWRRRFGADEHLVGRILSLGAEPFTVVGVAPDGFHFAGQNSDAADLWIPLAVARKNYAFLSSEDGRGSHFLDVMGRRRPGVSVAQAQAQLHAIAARVGTDHPAHAMNTVGAEDLHEALVGSSRQGIGLLLAGVGLVFLILCANVANLLLARAASRRSEMAARVALGATRGRLIAQMLTETAVVFVLAALGGTGVAYGLVERFGKTVLDDPALAIAVGVDWTALAFGIAFALFWGVLVGLVPAIDASSASPQSVLKESAARASLGRIARTARSALVVTQVALAFALLVGSGLAVRGFMNLASSPLGFDPEDVATAKISLPAAKYDDPEKVTAFFREVAAKAAALPGVESVSANGSIPMGSSNHNGSFAIEGRPPWPRDGIPILERHTVLPGYFRTLGITLLRGRDFTDADVSGSRQVMIISKTTADRFFPGEDPIGHRIDWGDLAERDDDHQWREIVGVVDDVRHLDRSRQTMPESYAPLSQHIDRSMFVVARTKRVREWQQQLPALVASIDPQQAVATSRAMEEWVAQAVRPQRFIAQLLGAFAVAALLLATLGIFGLVSYTTTQRTREVGIRMALGSSPEGIVALIMRDGVRLLMVGLALGFGGALLVGRTIASRVAGASAFDGVVVGIILGVLAVFGTLASLVPALRAVRIPPAASLRYE
jgi:putative ABC transport system permease protein